MKQGVLLGSHSVLNELHTLHPKTGQIKDEYYD